MSHPLRVFGLFCLLAPLGAVQAQTSSSAALLAAQVEKKAPEHPTPAADPSPEMPVTMDAEAVPASTATPAPAAAMAEMVTVKGRVLDEANKPLAGVVVFAKDVAAIASTNADGEYKLEVPAGVNTLTFSYAGYEDQQLQASNFLPTSVRLLPATSKKKLARNGRH